MTTATVTSRPYRPDNTFDLRGSAMLAIAVVGAALVCGFLAHYISQWFYLILAFPILIGFGVGTVGAWTIGKTGFRNSLLAALIGLVGGVSAMAVMHYFDYRTFTRFQAEAAAKDPEFAEIVRANNDPIPYEPDENDAPVNDYQRRKEAEDIDLYVTALRVRSLPQYMDYAAKEGVTITSSRSGDKSPTNLGYVGSFIYWIVEALIVAGVALGLMRTSSRRPYCVGCGTWKSETPVGYFAADPAETAAAVRAGDVARLHTANPTFDPSPAMLHLSTCPNGDQCRNDPREDEIRIERITYDKKGKITARKTLEHAVWPAPATADVRQWFAAPASTADTDATDATDESPTRPTA